MPRGCLALLVLLPLFATAALADPGPVPAAGQTEGARTEPVREPVREPIRGPAAPGPGSRQAAPTAAPRRPRSYEQCRAIAFQRHYFGAERRHYIARCQLGYGRPLFRRRGSRSAAPPAHVPPGNPGG